MDLDLQGRTASAHIDKYELYGNKSDQHAISAAVILQDVQDLLGHGKYGKWLKKYGINRRTASRLMLSYNSPSKAAEIRDKDATAKREKRAADRQMGQTSVPKTADNPLKTTETLFETEIPHNPLEENKRAQLIRSIRDASDDQIDRLFDRYQEGYLYV